MIEVIPYRAEHLMQISLQEDQMWLGRFLDHEQAKSLEAVQAFTGMVDGRPVICAGLIEIHSGRALCWSYVDQSAGLNFLFIHRAVKRFLDMCDYNRIEAEVAAGFDAGHRWMQMLGFKLEAPRLRSYFPDGRDCSIYARVK